MIARFVALATALLVTGAAAPALAQSYEETVNFIVTGSSQTNESTFGNKLTLLTTSTINGYDANACTFDLTMRQEGFYLAFVDRTGASNPTGSDDSDAPAQKPQDDLLTNKPDYTPPSMVTRIKLDFNAVSSWRIDPITDEYGLIAYQFHLDGTGKTITSMTRRFGDGAEKDLTCTNNCGLLLSPDTDLDRFKKAMDYLFSQYCAGSYSAF